MTEYNVNDLFPGINTFDQNLMFVEEKNNNTFFALLPVSEHNGVNRLAVPVQSYFKGEPKKSKDFIIRCLFFANAKNLQEAVPVGLVVNSFVAGKLAETFKEADNDLVTRPNLLPDESNKQYLFQLKKSGSGAATRVEVVFSKVAIGLNPELTEVEFTDFATLVSEYDSMQAAMNKKFNNKEASTSATTDTLGNDVPF